MPAALGMQPLGNHQRWMQDAKVLLQIMYRINSVGIISSRVLTTPFSE